MIEKITVTKMLDPLKLTGISRSNGIPQKEAFSNLTPPKVKYSTKRL
jgi:hypothetical protein